ncbi:hypothetical protein Tco_1046045 [Tanacetum coccineum]
MDKRKKHFTKLRAEEVKRKPPTKAQKRNQMPTYLRNMAGYKDTQLKNKSQRERKLKAVEKKQLVIKEQVKNMTKKVSRGKKLEDDAEKAKLQLCLEIVPRDDEAVNVESLSTKYPIVDWKTHILYI